jgi:hypothetical protein
MANTRRTIYAESMENYSDRTERAWILYPRLLSLLKLKDGVSGGFIVNRLALTPRRSRYGSKTR